MNKYLIVLKNTWDEIFIDRINFSMWRVRTVLQLLIIYFLWASIMPSNGNLFGYNKEQMLTYIICTQLIMAIVFSTRTGEIAENIINGDLSIFLLKPIKYFKYWFFRDIGDKLMNISFSIVELSLIFLILKPPLFIQTNPEYLLLTIIALMLAVFLYFLMSCLISLIGFWSNEVWAPRFIFYTLEIYFSGGFFPLDILPKVVFNLFQILPFSYILYFPIKVYLGQLPITQIFLGFFIASFWIFISFIFLKFLFKKGLRSYSAVGR